MAKGKMKKEPARCASSRMHWRRTKRWLASNPNARKRGIQCAQEHRLLLPNVVSV
jgi:hypothetical protein